MTIKINYDKEFDVLYIYKGDEKSKHSIKMFDNFIVDVNFNYKVIGLEIFNASKVLNVSKHELENVKAAQLSTYVKGIYFGANYAIALPKGKIESQIIVPQLAHKV